MFQENTKMTGMNLFAAASIILSENVPKEYKNDRNELVCAYKFILVIFVFSWNAASPKISVSTNEYSCAATLAVHLVQTDVNTNSYSRANHKLQTFPGGSLVIASTLFLDGGGEQ